MTIGRDSFWNPGQLLSSSESHTAWNRELDKELAVLSNKSDILDQFQNGTQGGRQSRDINRRLSRRKPLM